MTSILLSGLTANPITWIAWFFGWVMEYIFRFVQLIGLPNIGLCIIIFTIVTKIILYPLSLKQAKSQKLTQVIQPEISAIQAKYKGKENDQQAMMMQQAEVKAVYEKYGTSMTAGCLPLLIQLPIIFGLYRVIVNIPEYVPSVALYYENIVNAIGGEGALGAINQFIANNDLTNLLSQARISGSEVTSVKEAINVMGKFSAAQWDAFTKAFSSFESVIAENHTIITKFNNFLGIDLSTTPSAMFSSDDSITTKLVACVIPALAGISQFAATKVMQVQNPQQQNTSNNDNDPSKATTGMLNTMNYMMPIMSVVFCFSFAAGIGVYWIAQSVVSTIQQIIINDKMNKLDVDALIKANLEKTNAKRAKKGLPPVNEKAAEENYKKMQAQLERAQAKRDAAVAKTSELKSQANSYYKTSSIADRAKMVQQYNEKNNKKK